MRRYKEYIVNSNEFNQEKLIDVSGIMKFSIKGNDYITYGKSIARTITSIIVRLETRHGINQKFQELFDEFGDESVTVTILEIGDYENLREKSKDYILKLKPSLNYQRSGKKESGSCFSKEHIQHLAESKIGEKHNRAKLTEEQAIAIKKLALYSNMSSGEIGKKFNISSQQVRKIKLGQAWAHLKV